MDPLQQAAAVLLVLVLLGATIYALRTKGMAMILRRGPGGARQRQLESIDRLPLTPHHSLHLVRVEGRTVLIAVSPGGCSMVDRGGDRGGDRGSENPFADGMMSQGGATR